jgi:putative ABC transport system permease protein
MLFKTALRFILFDKPKSIGALAGTVISVFLIGQQSGIFIFLTNAMASLVQNNSEYVWVVDDRTTNVNALAQLNQRIGRELESIEGVQQVYPLVVSPASARFKNGKSAGITLIGVQYPQCAGGPWRLFKGDTKDLITDGAVFTDYFDKNALGGLEPDEFFEINGKQVYNAGLTKGVRAFGGGTYTFTTIERARYLGKFPNDKVSAFLVKISNPTQELLIINRINATLPGIKAWNAEEFRKASILTVLKTSGIAISFGTLIVFALIVGFVIIGLTLYSSAIDRIRDYGTLKAIGANNNFIRRLIITQAIIIGVTGFILGSLLVEGFRAGLASAGTLFDFPIWLRLIFLLVTLFIAFFGSAFAINRITRLEPAQVFRG